MVRLNGQSSRATRVEGAIDEASRRFIFRALVELEDTGATVLAARARVARACHVTLGEIRRIEQEGIDHEWPPL